VSDSNRLPSIGAGVSQGPICVLGMHRSGTSAVSRMLNLLGVDLGPEVHRMEASDDNPAGFWEHRMLANLNDELLARLGGSWDRPPETPPGWEAADSLDDIRTRAAAVITHDFRPGTLWGWKDPRTCLTLPFWRALVPEMRYVLCVRSPQDVARSLEARNGLTVGQSLALWHTYTERAVAHTTGASRLVVSYDEVVDQPQETAARLQAFIGPSATTRSVALAAESIDRALRHHHSSTLALAEDSPVPAASKRLYLGLLLLASGRLPESSAEGLLQILARESAHDAEQLRQRLTVLTAELARLDADRRQLDAACAALEVERAALETDRATIEAARAVLAARNAALEEQVRDLTSLGGWLRRRFRGAGPPRREP